MYARYGLMHSKEIKVVALWKELQIGKQLLEKFIISIISITSIF